MDTNVKCIGKMMTTARNVTPYERWTLLLKNFNVQADARTHRRTDADVPSISQYQLADVTKNKQYFHVFFSQIIM